MKKLVKKHFYQTYVHPHPYPLPQWESYVMLMHANIPSKFSGENTVCNNEAVVAVINSRSCKDGDMLYLLRSLFFLEAKFQFSLVAAHISWNLNTLADALSWNNLPFFLQLSSKEVSGSTSLPSPLLELLAIQRPDWTSAAWREKFKDILNLV